ncbi:type II toxin-antitoxin system Phd/YefM family antitoxin [Leifsonia sp. YAF41]|uniref:type II toxin-antitoxin system Phd/YefM family antitoxin n=1 Tax=Leifsonia sp. YAF41 TaxID=3233086 RepID=UPI003F9E0AF8
MQYLDDPDQLPALPDPGPRDGRHGVDRDDEYDPFPVNSGLHGAATALVIPIDEAKRHVSVLIARAESGQEVVVTRHGIAIARMVPPRRRGSRTRRPATPLTEDLAWRNTLLQPGATLSKPASAPRIASVTRVESLAIAEGAVVVGEIVVDANGTLRALVLDDLDQLPALPDPGPRDGRHGVDRETEASETLRRPPRRPSKRSTPSSTG